MTQEEKNLLLKDLCARLPYNTIVQYNGRNAIPKDKGLTGSDLDCNMEYYKPYLRPIEKMTEREWEEFTNIYNWCHPHSRYIPPKVGDVAEPLEWLNEHHIDHHRLIEKGLALEAPEGMYKIQEDYDN